MVQVLCIDAGSSSLKFALYDLAASQETEIQRGSTEFEASARTDPNMLIPVPACAPSAIGHRIVFGGPDHLEPILVTPELLEELDRLVPLDPLHLSAQLAIVRACEKQFPGVAQVLCFDTAFFGDMPHIARMLPIPKRFSGTLRRYGFHGLSYEYIVAALGEAAEGRVIIAHLGSGASLAAVRNRKPIDSSMGFSPLGGLMMGTRPGDMDPGAIVYLLTVAGCSVSELIAMLNEDCGLLGVSGTSADMRTLIDIAKRDAAAKDAVDLFVYQARKHIGALTSVLGGLDTLVFTGGIGEKSAMIRKMIADGLAHMGVRIDDARNMADDGIVSSGESHVVVRVIPTNENLVIARHTRAVLCA